MVFRSVAEIKKLRADQNKKINKLLSVSDKLKKLAHTPVPLGLTPQHLQKVSDFTNWFEQMSANTKKLAITWRKKLSL
jgi:hypothetical protein